MNVDGFEISFQFPLDGKMVKVGELTMRVTPSFTVCRKIANIARQMAKLQARSLCLIDKTTIRIPEADNRGETIYNFEDMIVSVPPGTKKYSFQIADTIHRYYKQKAQEIIKEQEGGEDEQK